MLRRIISSGLLNKTSSSWSRCIHTTLINQGDDKRDKRVGHVEESDKLEGESGVVPLSLLYNEVQAGRPFEYVDDKLMDKFIDNVRFKDIPIIHMICTRNNTKICLTQGNGSVLTTKTGGSEGYKNCRKGTTVAAQAVAARVVSIARDHEIKMARLVFNGLGPGRGAAYKVLEMSGIKIVSLSDRTEATEPWTKRPRKAKRL